MPISTLTICCWSGVARRDEVIASPSWSDVEQAIRRLNGLDRNDIYLRPVGAGDDTFLGVGGGNGQYVVTGSEGGERFPTLENLSGSKDEMVSLCVGGQKGEYPARYVVDIGAALNAARQFTDAGSFDCGISWTYWQPAVI